MKLIKLIFLICRPTTFYEYAWLAKHHLVLVCRFILKNGGRSKIGVKWEVDLIDGGRGGILRWEVLTQIML